MTDPLYSCVAYPCPEDRVKSKDGTDSSAFCKEHKAIHAKSVKSGWVKHFYKLMGKK